MKSPHSHENYHLKQAETHHLKQVEAYMTDQTKDKNWGITVTVDELYRLRSEALHLTTTPSDAVNSLFPGAFQAVFHGRGLEFDEVRAYQWGDDHRTVDWRVTARTGQMHTKLFHQEKERSLYLVIDCGPSMHFGSRTQFKWVLAAKIAAIFAWLAVENGDRVGLILFGHQNRCKIIPPGMGQASLLKIFKVLATQKFEEKTEETRREKGRENQGSPSPSNLNNAFFHLQHLAHSDALVLCISDFMDLNQAANRHLAYLSHHHEIAAIKVYDPLESQLPSKGSYAISDGQQVSSFNSQQVGLQQAYSQLFEEHYQQIKATMDSYAIRLLHISTEQNSWQALRQALKPTTTQPGKQTNG